MTARRLAALLLLTACSRSSRHADAGAPAVASPIAPPGPLGAPIALTAVPALPPGSPADPTWDNLCIGNPRSRYMDWGDVLVVTPGGRCFKDKRRSSPRIVLDVRCGNAGELPCGRAIQCPPPGSPLRNACAR